MDFEVEFHPVGDASKAGDAITIRYGVAGQYKIIVVDGGTDDAGDAVVSHIKQHYGANPTIEHVICTHPDSDHACGLRSVLKAFPVQTLWLHGVWHHAAEMLPFFEDKRWTAEGLEKKIRSEYSVIQELIELASKAGTDVYEPFAGQQIGPLTVLSPTPWVYSRLVPQFRKTPAPDVDRLRAENMWIEPATTGPARGLLAQVLEMAKEWISENWDLELLKDGAVTAAENESSTVLWGQFDNTSILLTGDAGVNALWWAMDEAEGKGFDLNSLKLVQVPHHGSRSNVGPAVLDRLLGPRLGKGSAAKRDAIVSVPKDDENHPRKMVMNAFRRRGAPVNKTQGFYYRYHGGALGRRPNESTAVPFDFFDKVEAYD